MALYVLVLGLSDAFYKKIEYIDFGQNITEDTLYSYQSIQSGVHNVSIRHVLLITGDISHDYLVKVMSAGILQCKVIFSLLSWGR